MSPYTLFSLCILLLSPTSMATPLDQSLSSPSTTFSHSLKSAIAIVTRVASTIASAATPFPDFRLTTAISDCLELLDFTTELLSWTLSTVETNGRDNSTGDVMRDMGAWLSAAMNNQDRCLDGFVGEGSLVKSFVGAGMEEITATVRKMLERVRRMKETGGDVAKKDGFPEWVREGEGWNVMGDKTVVAADVTVAADGSGDYRTVRAAVEGAPERSRRRYVIYVKKGVYKENVEVKKKKWNVMLVGEGMDETVISGHRNYVDGWTTFRTATFAVSGRGFIAKGIRFENTAGAEKHQAVALRSDSDLSVFFRCSFHGHQDTLYAHSLRQFYRECVFSGTVDFIFGNAAAVFQTSVLLPRKGLPGQKNAIFAQGRQDPLQTTGFTLQFSNISRHPLPLLNSSSSPPPTYLGRPWKNYSRVVVMQSYIGEAVVGKGWLEWDGDFALSTLFFAEFDNSGPGSDPRGRVRWEGFHLFNRSSQVSNFTVENLIDGRHWLPSTGVRFTAGFAV